MVLPEYHRMTLKPVTHGTLYITQSTRPQDFTGLHNAKSSDTPKKMPMAIYETHVSLKTKNRKRQKGRWV